MIFTNRPTDDKRFCCVIDFDGVIFNLMASIEITVYNLKGIRFKRENILTYDFNKSLDARKVDKDLLNPESAFGVSREFIFSLMGDSSIYTHNCYYNGFKKAIMELSRHIPVVVYSYCLSDNMASAKATLFEDLFRGLSNVYYCTASNGGNGFKAAYPDAKYVIEDSLANIDTYLKEDNTFEQGRKRLYLIDQTYNQERYNPDYSLVFSRARRVASVVDAINHIIYRSYTNVVIDGNSVCV